MLLEHPLEGNVPVHENASRALGCKFGGNDRVHIGSAAETIGEEQDVGVALRRDREGAEVKDADGNAGSYGQGHRDDGLPDRQPRGFPCLTLQAVARPPPGADAHTNPPVKMFEHSHSARGAEVAGSCRKASLHGPRAHEQRYISTNTLIVQQTSRTSHRMLRGGRGVRSRLTEGQDDAVIGGV